MSYYCPVCYNKMPLEAFKGRYLGCLEYYYVTVDGWVCTAFGTLKLGRKPDGSFESMYPKAMFNERFQAIRERQQTGTLRIGRCT